MRVIQSLVAKDPDNYEWLRQDVQLQFNIAKTLFGGGDVNGAGPHAMRAVENRPPAGAATPGLGGLCDGCEDGRDDCPGNWRAEVTLFFKKPPKSGMPWRN